MVCCAKIASETIFVAASNVTLIFAKKSYAETYAARWPTATSFSGHAMGVQLSRKADQTGVHQSLVRGVRGERNRRFSLARFATHVGELARASTHTAIRT